MIVNIYIHIYIRYKLAIITQIFFGISASANEVGNRMCMHQHMPKTSGACYIAHVFYHKCLSDVPQTSEFKSFLILIL